MQESCQKSSNISWFDLVQFACASTQSQFEPRFYEGKSLFSNMPSISKVMKVSHSPCQEWGDAFLQPWDNLQAYAFPPIAIINRVLLKLRASHNCDLTLIAPLLASKGTVSRSAGTSIRHSNRTTQTLRSAATTAFPTASRKSPYASSDCVATLRRFASQAGFSATVAFQLALCRRKSTRLPYQARWGKFRQCPPSP